MSRTISLEEAERDLPRLIQRAAGGEEIVIVAADGLRTRLVSVPLPTRVPRRPAHALKLAGLADDFDAPLEGSARDAFEATLTSE